MGEAKNGISIREGTAKYFHWRLLTSITKRAIFIALSRAFLPVIVVVIALNLIWLYWNLSEVRPWETPLANGDKLPEIIKTPTSTRLRCKSWARVPVSIATCWAAARSQRPMGLHLWLVISSAALGLPRHMAMSRAQATFSGGVRRQGMRIKDASATSTTPSLASAYMAIVYHVGMPTVGQGRFSGGGLLTLAPPGPIINNTQRSDS